MMRIGFLGAGKMAEAILAALIRNDIAAAADIRIRERLAPRVRELRRKYGVTPVDSATELVRQSDVLFLAVKPQDLDALLQEIAPVLTPRQVVFSIAAGKTLAHLQKLAGSKVRLVRVMPNLPMMAGEGMSAFCLGRQARLADRKLAARLLGCCGRAVELPERHFHAVTALSGSGPAFFAYVLSGLSDAAIEEGLPPEAARLLATQTMLGAARYLLTTGLTAEELIRAVASPKGTTAAGLTVLDKSPLRLILGHTIQAAAQRSAELGQTPPQPR
jgi:pyrroline-5-carboxylate reductase